MERMEHKGGSGSRNGFAEFLVARRAELRPADVGLPGGGRRRTPGLRREEVAILAGVRCRLHSLCAPNAGCSANVP
ncbi:hypothetical protein [Nocardia sp. NPDC050710]|uniref:hypothetical protein n=1 Tax=Nocardia sp. NPDC050710 TaxID=3157220 RepID=UPI003409F302